MNNKILTGKHPDRLQWPGVCFLTGLMTAAARAQTNAPTSFVAPGTGLPDAGSSVLRVFGALVLVTAIFLGGVWLFRNWQRLSLRKSGSPRLNVIEVRSLGQRQALYVVGYEQQRMLLASSPNGVTLVSHLPEAAETPVAAEAPAPRLSFAEAFQQVISRKT